MDNWVLVAVENERVVVEHSDCLPDALGWPGSGLNVRCVGFHQWIQNGQGLAAQRFDLEDTGNLRPVDCCSY